jgi:uncharacterized damage-inducible protein DinB
VHAITPLQALRIGTQREVIVQRVSHRRIVQVRDAGKIASSPLSARLLAMTTPWIYLARMSTLTSFRKLFAYYKDLGEKAIAQVKDEQLHTVMGADGNSIAVVMQHIAGNARSRFTDFLTTDGEKPWRDREGEFTEQHLSREALMADWTSGWNALFTAIDPLTDADLERIIHIRNEGHTVQEALHRQLAHYAYHVGQVVLLARAFVGGEWKSLSIPRGASQAFNAEKFARPAERKHFTDKEK